MSRRSLRNSGSLADIAADAMLLERPSRGRPSRHARKSALNSLHKQIGKKKTMKTPTIRPSSTQTDEEDELSSPPTGKDADGEDADAAEAPAVSAPSDLDMDLDQAGLSSTSLTQDSSPIASGSREDSPSALSTADSEPLQKVQSSAPGENDDDDDDIYNAVDLISDSDGEDPEIEEAEEANLINEITSQSVSGIASTELTALLSSTPQPGDLPFFDEQLRRLEHSILDDDHSDTSVDPFEALSRIPSPPPPTPTTTTRRVHFDASALKSPYAALNEHEILFPSGLPIEDMDDDNCSIGLSGYETDGETTDEEEVPVTVTKSPRDVLHQPSWTEEAPASPATPGHRSRKLRTPKVNKPCGPRLASWSVHPHKALGQSDENGAVVVMMPHKPKWPALDDKSGKPASPVTACLRGRSASLQQEFDVPVPVDSDAVTIPDPVLGTGTDAAMAGLMDNIIGSEGPSMHIPSALTDFLPANDVLDELDFAVANSDQESTDLDIMDFIALTDDSSNPDEDAKCLKLKAEDEMDVDEIFAPYVPSRAKRSPRRSISFDKAPASALKRGGLRAQKSAMRRGMRSGLALSKPSTRAASTGDRKRKFSDSFGHLSSRRGVARLRR